MPLWGTPQAGANPISSLNFVDLRPGDDETLLDGTEVIVDGSKSVAFARGNSPSGMDGGTTFSVTGCPNGSILDVQSSNTKTDVAGSESAMDASFQNVGGTISGNGFYTDTGRSMFYRVIVTDLVDGDVPVVVAKR